MVKNEPLPKKDFCARKTDRPCRQTENRKGWVGWWVGADQRKNCISARLIPKTGQRPTSLPVEFPSLMASQFFGVWQLVGGLVEGLSSDDAVVDCYCNFSSDFLWWKWSLSAWFMLTLAAALPVLYNLESTSIWEHKRVGLLWLDQCRNITHWKYW